MGQNLKQSFIPPTLVKSGSKLKKIAQPYKEFIFSKATSDVARDNKDRRPTHRAKPRTMENYALVYVPECKLLLVYNKTISVINREIEYKCLEVFIAISHICK